MIIHWRLHLLLLILADAIFFLAKAVDINHKIRYFIKGLSLTPPSSRGLGHLPFTEATGIRIPLGVLLKKYKLIFVFKPFLLHLFLKKRLSFRNLN